MRKPPPAEAVPLVLGVTGHRDVAREDEPALRAMLMAEWSALRKRCPHTPLVLLSQLAPGADQLVARWAREMSPPIKVLGVQGGQATAGAKGLCDELVCLGKKEHPLQAGGAYIARHSEVLFALWDGVESEESSTAQVIRWQDEGAPAPRTVDLGVLDAPERAPVCHLVTPREGQPRPPAALTAHWLFPTTATEPWEPVKAQAEARREWQVRTGRLNEFNRDVARAVRGRASQKKLGIHEAYLFPDAKAEELSLPLKAGRRQQALADALAQRFQFRVRCSHASLLTLVVTAGTALVAYAHLFSDAVWLLALYLSAVLAGALLAGWVLWRQWHRKWLDYRALAEAMRVEFFWRLAGRDECAADHYLRHARTELDWIRSAVRAWALSCSHHPCAPYGVGTSLRAQLLECQTHWLEDQKKFFKKKAPFNEARHKRVHRAARAALVLGVVFAAVLLWRHHTEKHMSHSLVLAVALCSLVAAVLHEHAETEAYRRLARSYEWMHELYDTACRRLGDYLREGDMQKASALTLELGREALAENGDWVLYHRERPPKLQALG